MPAAPSSTVRTLAITYIVVVTAVLAVALIAALGYGDAVEHWRHVPFPQLPRTIGEAASILLNNGRILFAAFGAALAVNSPWLTDRRDVVEPGRWWKATRALCDVALLLVSLRNVVTVGMGLAAYRERMVAAILPHGPVELTAFSCGITLYLIARRGPVPLRCWVTLVAAGAVLLAVAAPLEVFVVL